MIASYRALDHSAFDKGKLEAFPSQGKHQSANPTIQLTSVYCICQLIDNGCQKIECDHCGKWFHTACVKIEKSKSQTMNYS